MNQPSPKVVGCGGPDTLPVVADRARADVRRAGGHVVHLLGLDLAANKLWPARKRLGANSSRAANRPRLLAVVIDSGCSLLCAGQPAATQSLVRPLPRSNGIYCIGPVIPGRGSDLSYAGTCEGGPYFSWSATLATPALAQASSCSCVDPELPTPPIASLPIMIGTPPPKARMSATSRCAAYLGSSVRF